MLYQQYVYLVQERAGLATEDHAARAIDAVFDVLFERITNAHAADLLQTLPIEMRSYRRRSPWPEAFGAAEFVTRVAWKEKLERGAAEIHIRAVLSVLAEFVLSEELVNVLDYLPKDMCRLFAWTKESPGESEGEQFPTEQNGLGMLRRN